jgi:UDP-GlcNAc:undecaprenyl-phosphate GlcNAc-1-phosphate transferase
MPDILGNNRINLVIFALCCVFFALLLLADVKVFFISRGLAWLYIFLFSLFLSFIATPIARAVALSGGILDQPNERKVHINPTPLLGGVAVYLGFAGSIFYNFAFSLQLKGIGVGATLILLAGLADDVREMHAALKLLIQIIAVTVMISYGVALSFMPDTPLGNVVEVVFTYLWMLGIINAVNFLDGLDGLAAGLGAISSLYISLVAISTHQTYLIFLSTALLGSCLGFLPHNFKSNRPAAIFLGDAGSSFIGFSLAALAIMGGWGEDYPIKAYIMPTLILGIFIYDMFHINISRITSKKVTGFREILTYVGKDHIHHRLMALGLGKRATVLFIYLVSASLGLGALAMTRLNTAYSLLLLVQGALTLMIIAILMIRGASLLHEDGRPENGEVR